MKHAKSTPRIILSSEHGIDRSLISPKAVEVVDILKSAGYSSELVGGCVRDLLLGRKPKDFDVTTNARPEEVRTLFRRCEVFGRRFQIAQVRIKNEVIQVATYRRSPTKKSRRRSSRFVSLNGKIIKDNLFGNIQEDAFRRDLTINSLYLHPSDMKIVDYTGGYEDARNGIVRIIGCPAERYREDPVRMLRAIRFVSLPEFTFDAVTEKELSIHAHLLSGISNYRLSDELHKLLFNGRACATLELLHQHDFLRILFPPYKWLKSGMNDNHGVIDWMHLLLDETDERIQSGEHTSLAFTLAAILWPKFKNSLTKRSRRRRNYPYHVARDILHQQNLRTYIAGNVVRRIEAIWLFQKILETEVATKGIRLVQSENFRPAVRLFELRSKSGEVEHRKCRAWVKLRDQEVNELPPRMKKYRNRPRWR